MRNRAILEMVAVLKANTLHPQAEAWVKELESVLATPGNDHGTRLHLRLPQTPPGDASRHVAVAPRPSGTPQAVR
jgi:hypothetical protein